MKKIIGIFVCMLLIATVLPISGNVGVESTSMLSNNPPVVEILYPQNGSIVYTRDSNIYVKYTDGTLNRGTETFYPTDDTFIRMKDPGNNYGSSESIQVRNRYGYSGHPYYWEHDILIRFDISSISSNSIIKSANLNIFYYGWASNNPSGRELTLHKIIDEWNEDMVTWDTQPGYDLEVTSVSFVPSSTGVWMTWDVSSDVQEYVVDQDSNYGWQIMDEQAWNRFDIPNSKFRSKEYSDKFSPYLEIETENGGSFKTTFIIGKITNLNTEEDIIIFEAVNIRCIQFFPFGFIPYTSGEMIVVSEDYIGVLTLKFIFAVCEKEKVWRIL